jgi:hypothetical protein
MREYAVIIGVIVVVVGVALWIVNGRAASAPRGQACTMEAKICPDGSAVGRTGPNCEFAPCPPEALCEGGECPAVATTTSSGGGVIPHDSGVRGTVSLGPTCPVERIPPDPACADKPYAAAILVYRTGSGTPFIIGNSDMNGAFQFSLPPGSYTINAGSGKTLPRCTPVDVVVPANGYASTTISCDTGIR